MGGEDDSLMERTKRWKTLARSSLAGQGGILDQEWTLLEELLKHL